MHHYQDDTDERRLAAYIITNGPVALTVTDIRNYLIERMAAHMIPTAFVFLDELPLSDELSHIWSDVLEIQPVGVTDLYFELGGDSLRAFQILSRMTETLDFNVSIKDFFYNPTIRDLAQLLGNSK